VHHTPCSHAFSSVSRCLALPIPRHPLPSQLSCALRYRMHSLGEAPVHLISHLDPYCCKDVLVLKDVSEPFEFLFTPCVPLLCLPQPCIAHAPADTAFSLSCPCTLLLPPPAVTPLSFTYAPPWTTGKGFEKCEIILHITHQRA
jgi:hypothetical protein